MIENRNINDLKVHPKIELFFDNIMGQKWIAFVESIRKYGVLTPLIVTPEGVIISGYQRYRACKEIGTADVPCRIISFKTTDEEVLAIINMNMLQHNAICDPSIKLGRMIIELERIYGADDRNKGGRASASQTSRKDICDSIGVDRKVAICSKGIARMMEEAQALVTEGIIAPRVAYDYLCSMSPEKQKAVAKSIRDKWDGHQRILTYQVKEIIQLLDD